MGQQTFSPAKVIDLLRFCSIHLLKFMVKTRYHVSRQDLNSIVIFYKVVQITNRYFILLVLRNESICIIESFLVSNIFKKVSFLKSSENLETFWWEIFIYSISHLRKINRNFISTKSIYRHLRGIYNRISKRNFLDFI